jgi:hypothetical protein
LDTEEISFILPIQTVASLDQVLLSYVGRHEVDVTALAISIDFSNPWERIMLKAENKVLRGVLANQWRAYTYNQEYIQFLLGGYTDEEFTAIAERYAISFDHIDRDQLKFMALIVLNALPRETITSGDLSFLLNVDPIDVEVALSSYPPTGKHGKVEDKKAIEKR